MTDAADADQGNEVQAIALAARHVLEVRRGTSENSLQILSPAGDMALCITISAEGISLSLPAGDVTLRTSGALAIEADQLSLRGRQSVEVVSGGDLAIRAQRDLRAEARAHDVRATLGNINLRANDDVCLDGERIRLNAPAPAAPRSMASGSGDQHGIHQPHGEPCRPLPDVRR